MGCQAIQSFLVKNKNSADVKKIAGFIYGAPFFEFHPIAGLSFFKRMLLNLVCKDEMSHALMLNTGLPISWVCTDKQYFRKIMFIDGQAVPFASANAIKSMDDAIMDIKHNYKATSNSFLMILAGKDKLVDNHGGREFYSKTGTPSDRKQIKLFPNSYH